MEPNYTHHVKVREKGKKQWSFLSRSGTNRLRVHALRFTAEGAAELIADSQADNPGWDFKAVLI